MNLIDIERNEHCIVAIVLGVVFGACCALYTLKKRGKLVV